MYEYTSYKHFALQAAKELGYSNEVIEKIKAAKKDSDIERIMASARKEKSKRYHAQMGGKIK